MKRILWLLGLLGLSLARGDELSARLIVLANSRQPESVALARFYTEQRDIPETNVIALPLPVEESITWRQFIDEVWRPLQDELYRRGWIEGTASSLLDPFGRRRYAPSGHRISYLVTCRGVPLRIHHDPTLPRLKDGVQILEQFNRNEAAVDAELSLLALGNHEIAGLVGNPLFAQRGPLTLDAAQVVKVTRLDGPTWESARRLVSSALAAERSGLIGRYYLDLRGPHAEGDKWLQTVHRQLEALGFPGDTEETAATLPSEARFDLPVFYFGWYADNLNGPFAKEGFAFPAGAVAVHIHSYSARTLHAPAEGWCGPLVARGVTATVGNVFEPFLEFTHRPSLLLRALSEGRNFGDASYYALPVLSWQAVAVGDPLYRPFKAGLEEQLERVDLLIPELAALVRLRQSNLLALRGQFTEAIGLARAALRSARAAGDVRLEEEVAQRLKKLETPEAPSSPTVLVK
ncbi:TIGR03790 family protein [Oleiharenicola lentus]|uniref:TIGR03790 family protein n=1 Tax=Oleiharenicola lentus TaxID=2508720 RepID=A0A4Q1C812_9BACT|nr:TIGR03790 family protein [Oleiharenicola lentus]RXK54932.1 TIGR03790 family protein [Oleiharenicola lentus]